MRCISSIRIQFAAALVACVSALSCSRNDSSEHWTIVASFASTKGDGMQALVEELQTSAARDTRLHVKIVDHAGNLESQKRQLSQPESCGDLVIVVLERSGILGREIRKLHESGHPVLIVGEDVGHESFAAALLTNDRAIGRAAGSWARARLSDRGNIVALKGNMSSRRSQDRQRGFLQGLTVTESAQPKSEAPRVVYESETDGTIAGARRAMQDALLARDEIDLVYAHSDAIAYGAFEAAVAAGRASDITLIGIGARDKGLAWLEDGILSLTIREPTGGNEAIHYATRILSGETIESVRVPLSSRMFDAETRSTGGAPVR